MLSGSLRGDLLAMARILFYDVLDPDGKLQKVR